MPNSQWYVQPAMQYNVFSRSLNEAAVLRMTTDRHLLMWRGDLTQHHLVVIHSGNSWNLPVSSHSCIFLTFSCILPALYGTFLRLDPLKSLRFAGGYRSYCWGLKPDYPTPLRRTATGTPTSCNSIVCNAFLLSALLFRQVQADKNCGKN